MNLKSLEYFKELTEDMNMTKTAVRLFISQQTLSNHILRLEEYYKVKLFERHPALKLTEAGLALLRFADTVLQEDKSVRDVFSDMQNYRKGVIKFGASPLRASECLPGILTEFAQMYPEVELKIINNNSEQLQIQAIKGELDVALCLLNDPPSSLFTEHMIHDPVYLCVPEALLNIYYPNEKDSLKQRAIERCDVSDFKKLPYFLYSDNNRLGQIASKCFEEADFVPRVYLNAKYIALADAVLVSGVAAAFLSASGIRLGIGEKPESINLFPLSYKGDFVYQDLYLVRNRKKYQPQYVKDFVALLKKYFINRDDDNIAQLV